MKVTIFDTCVVDLFFPQVAKDMVEVLERFGCECDVPTNQICCGQPTYNSGYEKESIKTIHNEIDTLLSNDSDYIVGPAGSCVAMLHEYQFMLKDDPEYAEKAKELAKKSYEFSQFLYRVLGVVDAGAELDTVATYHRSCHMTRLLGERETPYILLKHVKGLDLKPLPHVEKCCGFGGMFSAKEPALSQPMVDEKVDSIVSTGAKTLISCDPACLMNIGGRMNRRGIKMNVMHLANVLNHNVDPSRIKFVKDVDKATI